jgi:hypothetical protein
LKCEFYGKKTLQRVRHPKTLRGRLLILSTILPSSSEQGVIVLLLEKNEQMQEGFSQPHLGAFFAPQKTGLSGGSSRHSAA